MKTSLKTSQDLVDLFDAHYKDIYVYVFFKAYRNKEIAEDITQEVFIKAWEKRATFKKNKASLKTWLYVIARNAVVDYYRKQKFVAQVEEDVINNRSDNNRANQELHAQALKEFTIKQFDKLEVKEKELLVMRFIQEMKIEEIATIIRKQYNATKVAIHRAIKKLQTIVNNE